MIYCSETTKKHKRDSLRDLGRQWDAARGGHDDILFI